MRLEKALPFRGDEVVTKTVRPPLGGLPETRSAGGAFIKEEYHENYYLKKDEVIGGNHHSIIDGNEHTGQRPGTTATRPKTAR